MNTVLSAKGLSKRYGKRVAVDGIDFEVPAGRIVGLPESPITGVTLRHVTLAAEHELQVKDADAPVLDDVKFDIRPGNAQARRAYRE